MVAAEGEGNNNTEAGNTEGPVDNTTHKDNYKRRGSRIHGSPAADIGTWNPSDHNNRSSRCILNRLDFGRVSRIAG